MPPVADTARPPHHIPPVVVNGRFLAARPTGIHRSARWLLAGARRAGLDAEVAVPQWVHDPLAQRSTLAAPGRAGRHLWEQVSLPLLAGRRPILSLANTAPLGARTGVVTVHDLATLVGPDWFKPELRLYGWIVLRAARRATLVITVSQQVALELAEFGVAPERIRVVPNAVSEQFRPAPAQAVEELRRTLGLRRPYLLMTGWSDPRKDLATVLAAHRKIMAGQPHDLVLVGAAHRNFARVANPTDDSVRMLGYVDDGLLPALLSGAAALLYPSRYEGFGLPPVEALACGTPALVSDIPVLLETTKGAAVYLPVGGVEAWAEAMHDVLDGEIRPGPAPDWTWDDAGRALMAALAEVC